MLSVDVDEYAQCAFAEERGQGPTGRGFLQRRSEAQFSRLPPPRAERDLGDILRKVVTKIFRKWAWLCVVVVKSLVAVSHLGANGPNGRHGIPLPIRPIDLDGQPHAEHAK